ncbi:MULTISPECIES: ABC transporter permease [unclassified Pseudomonas]|uniref:ABC transporter permease n=1 Tax=unclassified Pseudomonas TaxID=196821 RepID=UPI003825A91A
MTQIENLAPAQAFELAMAQMRQKRWVEAGTLWRAFRDQYSGHAAPWLQGAVCLMRQGHCDNAEALLVVAREKFPKNPLTWLISADLAKLQNDEAAEDDILAQGQHVLSARWEIVCRRAELHMRKGDVEAAEALNQLAVQQRGDAIEPLIQAAEFADSLKDWAQSEQRWQAVVALKPDFTRGYLQLVSIYKLKGDLLSARRYRLAAKYGANLLEAVPSGAPGGNKTAAVGLTRFSHFLGLVFTKAGLNLKSEASRTYLNYVWVVAEPLLHLVIYYYLFGQILNAGVENYGLFLLCGLVPWMWFSKSVSVSASSIIGGQGLMLNSNLPAVFFPLVSMVQSTLKQLPALAALFVLALLTDSKSLTWNICYLPVIMALQMLLTLTVGMLLAAAVTVVRDLANLVGTGLMLLMFLSGVIYQYQSLPEGVGHWVQYNPLTLLIAAYRTIILEGAAPDAYAMAYVIVVTLVMTVVCAAFYKWQRNNFVRRGMA